MKMGQGEDFTVASGEAGDPKFTTDAIVLMDLAKTLTWKGIFDRVLAAAEAEGRELITREDVVAALEPALEQVISEIRKTAADLASSA
jgi:histone H3/H4